MWKMSQILEFLLCYYVNQMLIHDDEIVFLHFTPFTPFFYWDKASVYECPSPSVCCPSVTQPWYDVCRSMRLRQFFSAFIFVWRKQEKIIQMMSICLSTLTYNWRNQWFKLRSITQRGVAGSLLNPPDCPNLSRQFVKKRTIINIRQGLGPDSHGIWIMEPVKVFVTVIDIKLNGQP